ncbi:Tmem131 [Symbiodinium pilosum]|uniref:Tmem131 protein n=1 Tax=Symbiodinium pilosum TaxID=2952 RepID=A0A812ISF6_SYMPI|nr:Tmem131 [Symbiodinium pilosum]
MRPLLGGVLASATWRLAKSLAIEEVFAEPELADVAVHGLEGTRSQMVVESVYPPLRPAAGWEADYVKDDAVDGQWDGQAGYDEARQQRYELQKEAKKSLRAAVVAEEKYEDMQKKELKLRDKMLQARSLAKKQLDIVRALEDKQNWQKESLKWLEEDIKYGKGQIKKFEKAIKVLATKIEAKEKQMDAIKHTSSPKKKAAFTAQEVQEMASRLQRLQKILQKRKATLKATRKKFKKLREEELKAEKKLQHEEKKQSQKGGAVESKVLSSIWNSLGWS